MSTQAIYQTTKSIVNNVLRDLPQLESETMTAMRDAATTVSALALVFFLKSQPLFWAGFMAGAAVSTIRTMANQGLTDRVNLVDYVGTFGATVSAFISKNPAAIIGYGIGKGLTSFAFAQKSTILALHSRFFPSEKKVETKIEVQQ